MATTLPKCVEQFAPGPILRITILFGPSGSEFRQVLDDRTHWLGERVGRWIEVHELGNPKSRDAHADTDREARGVSLDALCKQWEDKVREFGGEGPAQRVVEFEAAKLHNLGEVDLPCLLVYFPDDRDVASRILPLRAWLQQLNDLQRAADKLSEALGSDRLLQYIRRTKWSVIGVDQLHELTDWVATSLGASEGAELRGAVGEAWRQYRGAITADPELADATDKKVYESVKRDGSVTKSFDNWVRNLRKARGALGQQKRQRRVFVPSRSVIPARERDRPRGQ